jgi:coproporphyrinogen III oxidase
MKQQISTKFKELQDYICQSLEQLDGKASFQEDLWERNDGGGGRTRIISNGAIFEKGGVNFSEVFGPVTPMMKSQLNLDGNEFYATGVSIVLHPKNPFHPIMHMNVRYFEMDSGKYWFGGGIDMTPHYINKNAASRFHQELETICNKYDHNFYPDFKKWADDYFYIPHREETRGVGGIFYDHIEENDKLSKNDLLAFAIDLGEAFPKLYGEQVTLCSHDNWTKKEEEWRDIRRGRYVEFNLVYDRGTKFGLKTAGRIESILMSLPERASWFYNVQPESGSPEQKTLELLKKEIDWLHIK